MANGNLSTDNLFAYAPKELTNSALWTWILSSLKTPTDRDPRCQVARNMLSLCGLPAVEGSDIVELQAEHGLLPLRRPRLTADGAKLRLDIFMRFRCPEPAILFVENKVVENDVSALYSQMSGYYDHLVSLAERDPSYCAHVYPAYFGYEPFVAEKLAETARERHPELAQKLITFPVDKMIEAFQGTDADADPLLSQFQTWLKSKREFVTMRRKARLSENADVGDVIEAARDLGFGDLLETFMRCYRAHPIQRQIGQERVDIRNVNFLKGGATPFTLKWFYNSGPNGLYVGVHENCAAMTGFDLLRNVPEDFAYERRTNWIFGYLRSEDDVRRFFRAPS